MNSFCFNQINYSITDIVGYFDYLPFGQVMPNRHGNDNQYRYGFQGMQKDDEVKGSGNSYTTEFRQYDPRIGRWLSLDPMMKHFSDISPFVAFNNNPLKFVDKDGLSPDDITKKEAKSVRKFEKALRKSGIDNPAEATVEQIKAVWDEVKTKKWAWVKTIAEGNGTDGYTSAISLFKLKMYEPQKVLQTLPPRQIEWSPLNTGMFNIHPARDASSGTLSFPVEAIATANEGKLVSGTITITRINNNNAAMRDETVTVSDEMNTVLFSNTITSNSTVGGLPAYEGGNSQDVPFGKVRTLNVTTSADMLNTVSYYLVSLSIVINTSPPKPIRETIPFSQAGSSKRKFLKR
jgi:RHS repeat-associated protein